MENFYGVDEEEGEAELQDAASMAAFIKANKEERTRNAQSSDMAVAKGSIEAEEVGGTESVASHLLTILQGICFQDRSQQVEISH